MKAPLSLSITPRKAVYLAGEGILVDIAHEVFADLDMDTVELNGARTAVVIESKSSSHPPEVLTGEDHQRLCGLPKLQPIGSTFHAPAGSAWSTYLELSLYRLPLPAGKYGIKLRYRYGDTEESVVESNSVDIEVVPAHTASANHRWLAGGAARDELATAWVVHDSGGLSHWLYRTARRHDPSVVVVATDFGANAGTVAPVLAHLNDISPMHFARYAVWLQSNTAVFQKIHAYGAASGPVSVSTGLAASPAPVVVDPPLQRHDDSLALVVRGVDGQGRPTLACIDQPAEGAAQWRALPFPALPVTHCNVVWDAAEAGFDGRVVFAAAPDASKMARLFVMDLAGGAPNELFATPETIVDVVVDQGLAQGHILVLTRSEEAFHTAAWGLDGSGPVAHSSFPFEGLGLGASPPDPTGSVARAGEPALSLLFAGPEAWTVAHPSGKVVVSFDRVPADAAPKLVSTPRRGVYMLHPDSQVGFRSLRVEP